MTSEILIGNGHGIVMCADSAETLMNPMNRLGASVGGSRKMMGLHLPHRIGIMHAGSMSVCGVPIGSYLEGWSQSLPPTRLAHSRDYSLSFISYLKEMIPTLTTERELAERYVVDWFANLRVHRKNLSTAQTTSNDDVRNYFLEKIADLGDIEEEEKEFAAIVAAKVGRDSADNVLIGQERSILGINDLPTSIESAIDQIFAEFVNRDVLEVIYEWARIYSGGIHPNRNPSTVVMAGYADQEVVPTCTVLRLNGFAFGRLFWTRRLTRADSSAPHRVLFRTFGQDDSILKFLRQTHQSRETLETVVRECIAIRGSSLTECTKPDNEEVSSSESLGLEELGQEIVQHYSREGDSSVDRIMNLLSVSNLAQLADIARRLVLLESLALELRGEQLTVNADLMLATVSLDKGFVLLESPDL